MKRLFIFATLGLFLAVLAVYQVAPDTQAIRVVERPHFIVTEDWPEVSATAYAIFDQATGELLATKAADLVLPIASVTKLVTAATLLSDFELDTEVTISAADVAAEGRSGRLSEGDIYTYRELMFPLLLESSNDAAVALERALGGELVSAMNQLAQRSGATSLSLTDASGLSDTNVATVIDLVDVLRYVAEKEPHILDVSRLSKRAGPYVSWQNNSPVLDSTYVGGKHGYTTAANRTLAALFRESFGTNQRTIGYVLLGSHNLAQDTAVLRDFVTTKVSLK